MKKLRVETGQQRQKAAKHVVDLKAAPSLHPQLYCLIPRILETIMEKLRETECVRARDVYLDTVNYVPKILNLI